MSLNINKTNSIAKITQPASISASNSRKDELTGAAVNILLPTPDAKEEVAKSKNSSSTAKTAVKNHIKGDSTKGSQQQGSSVVNPKTTEVADASAVPGSGADGSGSRIGDLVKDGGKGLQSEIDKNQASLDKKIDAAQPKDTSPETSSGSGSGGGTGAYSLPGTGTNPALGPVPVGTNFGTVNNNFGQQIQNNNPPSSTPDWDLPNVSTPDQNGSAVGTNNQAEVISLDKQDPLL